MKKIILLLVIILVILMIPLVRTKMNYKTEYIYDTARIKNIGENNNNHVKPLVGTVTSSGSTTVNFIMISSSADFMQLNPGVKITYDAIGSTRGIINANTEVTQIGVSSRNLTEEEKVWGLTEKIFAFEGIAVIVNPENKIDNLTIDQIRNIYQGQIVNWNELGGKNEEILVITREIGSGTKGAFEKIMGFNGELTNNAIMKFGSGNVQIEVANNENAIGYVGFVYVNRRVVKDIMVNDVEPTNENILNGSYKLSRPFILLYHDRYMTDASYAFVDYILSPEGQEIVEDKGAIPVN